VLEDDSKNTLEVLGPLAGEIDDGVSPPYRPVVYGRTEPGRVRRNNEDQFLVATLERAVVLEQSGFPIQDGKRIVDQPPARLLVVADGMGGHDGGEVASTVAVDAIAHYAFSMLPWLGVVEAQSEETLAASLDAAVRRAQARIRAVAQRKGLDSHLGTTLTMAYVKWPAMYLVHVGDSRAYLFRGGELFRLTRDHNLAEEMVRRGVMTPEEARESRFASILTNALGGTSDDLHAEMYYFELAPGDVLLLCTDGLYGEVTDEAIARLLSHVKNPAFVEPCVESLIRAAIAAGGRDNVTAVVAHF